MKQCTREEIDNYLKDIDPTIKRIIDLKRTSEYVIKHTPLNISMSEEVSELYENAMLFIEKHLETHQYRNQVFDYVADLYSERFSMCIPKGTNEKNNSYYYESYYFVKWLLSPDENLDFYNLFYKEYLKDLLFTKNYILAYDFIYNYLDLINQKIRPQTLLCLMRDVLIPLIYAGDIENLKTIMLRIKKISTTLLPKNLGSMPIFFSEAEYDFAAFLLGETIIPEEIIRRANRSGFKNRTYLSKYPQDFLKCLKEHLKEQYGIKELPYYALDISKARFLNSNLSIPFYTEEKFKIPCIHDSETLNNHVYNALREAHKRTKKLEIKQEPIQKPINPYTPTNNKKAFDRSHLLVGKPLFTSELSFIEFERYVACYNNLECPLCGSKLDKPPAGRSKCKNCGNWIYYKIEAVYGRAMLLDEHTREEYYEFEKTFMDRFYIHRSCQEQGILEEALTLSQIERVSLIKSFEKIIKEKILESNDVLQKKSLFSALIHCYRMIADFRNEIRCVFEEMIFLYKFLGEEPNYGQTFIVFSMLEKKLTQSEIDEIYNDVCEKNFISRDTKEKLWFLLLKRSKELT